MDKTAEEKKVEKEISQMQNRQKILLNRKRTEEHRKSYYHVYSMDCSPGIENHAMFLVMSPEDLLIKEIDDAVAELMPARLAEALTHMSPIQARRLHARYALKKKYREIAADEGISHSCASESVSGAIKKLQRYFAKNGWLDKEV